MAITYEENLASQLQMLESTWKLFQTHGVTDDTELALDFCFVTSNEEQAVALSRCLDECTVQVRKGGFLFWKKWYVEGQTEPMRTTYDGLKEWLQNMVATGWKYDCEFDGFGARMPC